MNVNYEWLVEFRNADGGIIDVDHAETYQGALQLAQLLPKDGRGAEIALVCDAGRLKRGWAYVRDGVLESYIRDAYDHPMHLTPIRHIHEVERAHAREVQS